MGVAYWKAVGENIARGLGAKTIRRLGISGKLIGRAGAVVGVGFPARLQYLESIDYSEGQPLCSYAIPVAPQQILCGRNRIRSVYWSESGASILYA